MVAAVGADASSTLSREAADEDASAVSSVVLVYSAGSPDNATIAASASAVCRTTSTCSAAICAYSLASMDVASAEMSRRASASVASIGAPSSVGMGPRPGAIGECACGVCRELRARIVSVVRKQGL